MPFTNKERNRFLRTSKLYKKFLDLVNFINSLLTPEQQKILEFQLEEETIDFKTQLFLALENRRKIVWFDDKELKTRATKALDKYRFLFETNLNSFQIRTILLRELVEVISLGFFCSSIDWNNKYNHLTTKEFSSAIKTKYPNLPPRKQGKNLFYFWQECFKKDDKLVFKNKEIKKLWYSEFFKKTKWYFEQLNYCEPEYINKYREKLYQEIDSFLYSGCSSVELCARIIEQDYLKFHISEIKTNTNKYLQELVEEILSYFSETELISLEKIDSTGEKWRFKEQLIDRYYSKYASFVPLEEIKLQIKQKVEQYKPLLFGNQKETVKELFLDELEKGIFISKDVHFWNEEMLKNLKSVKTKKIWILGDVAWSINNILDLVGIEHEKNFYLEIEDKKYDLKTLLIARWKQAKCFEYIFERKTFRFKVFSTIFFEIGNNNEMSKTNIQILLEKMDFFFLTPRETNETFLNYIKRAFKSYFCLKRYHFWPLECLN